MSTLEVKERISKMTPAERDDIRLFLATMEESSPVLSKEWLTEIERRSESLKSGEATTRPYKEVMEELGFRK